MDEHITCEIFLARLKAWMIANGYTERTLSKALDVSNRSVGEWFRYRRIPRAYTIRKLAILSSVSADWWLGLNWRDEGDENIS